VSAETAAIVHAAFRAGGLDKKPAQSLFLQESASRTYGKNPAPAIIVAGRCRFPGQLKRFLVFIYIHDTPCDYAI
jgi:hypothetical protein